MNRILLALNHEKHNKDAIDFACYLAKLSRSKVTGVFLKSKAFRSAKESEGKLLGNDIADIALHASSAKKSTAVVFFEDACIQRDTNYSICNDKLFTIEELLAESRFADLLVVNAALSLEIQREPAPSALVKLLLKKAGCPVVLVPEAVDSIKDVIFTFNGTKASVFAIKQFTYLFPHLKDHNISLVEVKSNEAHVDMHEKDKLREWLLAHYTHVDYVTLKGDTVDQLMEYLLLKKDAFVVMGAYGPIKLSNVLKTSVMTPIAGIVNLPLFICH